MNNTAKVGVALLIFGHAVVQALSLRERAWMSFFASPEAYWKIHHGIEVCMAILILLGGILAAVGLLADPLKSFTGFASRLSTSGEEMFKKK